MLFYWFLNSLSYSICQSNYYHDGTWCRPCPEDLNCKTCQLENGIVKCTSCKDYMTIRDGVCSCQPGYYDGGYQCNSCNIQNCDKCKADQQCDKCMDGFYKSGKECLPCDNTCATCTGPGSCSTCKLTYGQKCVSSCPSKTFQSENTCIDCDQSCKECNGPYKYNCVKCEKYLYKNQCYSDCSYLPGQFELNNACEKCNESCQSCSGNMNNCLSCNNNNYFYKNKCYSNCNFLPNLYTLSSQFKCGLCNESCKTCDGPTNENCLSCDAGKYLSNKKCIPCHESCLSCFNSSEKGCSQCKSDYIWFNDVCISACPDGYYASNNVCHQCNNCLTCSGPNQCKSCQKGLELKAGKCVKKKTEAFDVLKFRQGMNKRRPNNKKDQL